MRHCPGQKPHRRSRSRGSPDPVAGGLVAGHRAVRAVVVDELFKVGEEVHWVHEMSSSVSTTDQPSFLKEGSRRWRRSARRLSTPATSRGSRRSPSRRSRTTLTSRQSLKCRRNSSYRSRRVRPTTKISTSTALLADRSRSSVPLRTDQSLDPPGPIETAGWSARAFSG